MKRSGPQPTKVFSNIEEEQADNESFGMLQEVLLNTLGDTKMTAMHREGIIECGNVEILIDKVLFDSGALHSDYISAQYVEKHRKHLEDKIYESKSTVKLGDNATTIQIKERILISVLFIDEDGKEHRATITPCIFDTTGNDLIIGLPSIACNFSSLFKCMLDNATKNMINTEDKISAMELKPPWKNKPDELAPEDEETPLPCSFTSALHFMEISFEQALQEFKSQINEHVSSELRKHTRVEKLLLEKGYRVFVPEKWEGINGLPPLELRWKDTLPESMKPRARPINPRLYENAKKEFDRLCEYLYVPSRGPQASCLVIAPKAVM